MRMSTVLVLVALVAAGALTYSLLRPGGQEVSVAPPADAPRDPVPKPSDARHVPTATTGTLIIRVRTPDAMPLPTGTRAGYVDGLDRRLRPAAGDGTFRFSDVPLGRVEVVAEAEGYHPGTTIAVIHPEVPAEVLVTLEAKP